MTSAVVFAYHDVGVRCLSVLLAHGVDVRLVLTHQDNPRELIWFDSVANLASQHDLTVMTPADPNTLDVVERVRAAEPDFLFSFYYRSMLGPEILAIPGHAALNMHGSLLPKYRGRVPVNWAIIHGERETGATLHHMAEKPDAGPIVDQEAVPILPDDVALDVFRKVVCAAEICLNRALPRLIDGTARATPQTLSAGSYFGGRSPADGIIDWMQPARRIHDLVRAVAPPYPGASTQIEGEPLLILRTLPWPALAGQPPLARPSLFTHEGRVYAQAGDGMLLRILQASQHGRDLPMSALAERLAARPLPLQIRR
jgi:methionyl-tRNA formyltransferase